MPMFMRPDFLIQRIFARSARQEMSCVKIEVTLLGHAARHSGNAASRRDDDAGGRLAASAVLSARGCAAVARRLSPIG